MSDLCGRDPSMVEPLCERCRRQIVAAHYRERAEQRDGQHRVYLGPGGQEDGREGPLEVGFGRRISGR